MSKAPRHHRRDRIPPRIDAAFKVMEYMSDRRQVRIVESVGVAQAFVVPLTPSERLLDHAALSSVRRYIIGDDDFDTPDAVEPEPAP